MNADEILLLPIFPTTEGDDVDFEMIDCVPSGKGVNLIEDNEIQDKSVIELSGDDSRITFYMSSNLPLISLHINSCSRFVFIVLIMRDTFGVERIVEISNRRSTLLVDGNTCKIPLSMGVGWQYMCLNADDIMSRAFGAQFDSFVEVTLAGGCKVSKMYLHGEPYADVQLPPFLRVAKGKI